MAWVSEGYTSKEQTALITNVHRISSLHFSENSFSSTSTIKKQLGIKTKIYLSGPNNQRRCTLPKAPTESSERAKRARKIIIDESLLADSEADSELLELSNSSIQI